MTDGLQTNTPAARRITLAKGSTFKVGEACITVEPVKQWMGRYGFESDRGQPSPSQPLMPSISPFGPLCPMRPMPPPGPIILKTAVNLSGRGSFCGRQGRRASGCEHECGERAGENRSQAFGIGPLLRSGFQ